MVEAFSKDVKKEFSKWYNETKILKLEGNGM